MRGFPFGNFGDPDEDDQGKRSRSECLEDPGEDDREGEGHRSERVEDTDCDERGGGAG